MQLYVLGRNEKILGTLTNEGLDSPNLLAAEEFKALNGVDTLTLTVTNDTDFVREENYVIYKNEKHEWEVFTIREITEIHGEGFTKEVVCEHSSQELLDCIPKYNAEGTRKSPLDIMTGVLNGTRWSVGKVDTPSELIPMYDLAEGISALEIIHKLIALYDYEVRYRFTIVDNTIVERKIDLVESIGKDYGKRFEYTKDIEAIERFVDSTEIKTAAIVIGGVREEDQDKPKEEQKKIDIVDLEWTSADGLATTKKGENFLEIKEATATWGYPMADGTMLPRMCLVEDNRFTKDREHLCEYAYQFLKEHRNPKITYKIDAVDLYALTEDNDYAHEGVALGDKVRVIDRVFNPPILVETKVIEVTRNLLEPSEVTFTLGDKVKSLINNSIMDSINQQLDDKINNLLQTEIYNGLAQLEQNAENIGIDKVDKESVLVNYNWIKNSDFTNNSKYWLFPLEGNIGAITGIPSFRQGAKLTKGNSLVQIVMGGKDLLESTVSLSAFIKGTADGGSGKLSLNLVYRTNDDTEVTAVWESKEATVVKDTWKRVFFASHLETPADLKEVIRLEAIFTCTGVDTNVTGVMLNQGSQAAKYIKNPTDKMGQGVWDEVAEIISDNFYNGTGYMYIEEGDGIWVYDKPIDQNPTKVTVMKGGQLGIGVWNANEQKWQVNTFIDGKSVNASCINTGTMTADRVRGGVLQSLDGNLELDLRRSNRGIQFKKNGIKSIDIAGGSMNFYDWEGNEIIGRLYSARLDDNENKPGIALGNSSNSYLTLVYEQNGNHYSYIRLDKYNIDKVTPCPVTLYSETEFKGSQMWFGHGINSIFNSTKDDFAFRCKNNLRIVSENGQLRFRVGDKSIVGSDGSKSYFETGNSATTGKGYFTFSDRGTAYLYTASGEDKIWCMYNLGVNRNLHVNGNFTVSGTKNCIQSTKHYGDVLFYSTEDTESYLTETCTEVMTVEATAEGTFERVILIEPVVKECINTEIDYIVDIHKVGWGDYRIKEQTRDYFILESDRADFTFKYTIKGKRIGFEDDRLVRSYDIQEAEYRTDATSNIDGDLENSFPTDDTLKIVNE